MRDQRVRHSICLINFYNVHSKLANAHESHAKNNNSLTPFISLCH